MDCDTIESKRKHYINSLKKYDWCFRYLWKSYENFRVEASSEIVVALLEQDDYNYVHAKVRSIYKAWGRTPDGVYFMDTWSFEEYDTPIKIEENQYINYQLVGLEILYLLGGQKWFCNYFQQSNNFHTLRHLTTKSFGERGCQGGSRKYAKEMALFKSLVACPFVTIRISPTGSVYVVSGGKKYRFSDHPYYGQSYVENYLINLNCD